MDNLVSILKIPALNHDVKNKILRLIQNWSIAFEGRTNLSYVGEVYKTLQHEGAWAVLLSMMLALTILRVQLPAARPCSHKLGDGRHPDSPRMD